MKPFSNNPIYWSIVLYDYADNCMAIFDWYTFNFYNYPNKTNEDCLRELKKYAKENYSGRFHHYEIYECKVERKLINIDE